MGLYYNPNPPHIGAQQPLTQKKLTPPQSGPLPQNPPFNGGAKIAQAILTCWAVAAAVAFTYPPVVAVNLDPPISAPATPLFKKTNYEIYRAWDATASAPITAINLDPPISGPQNPPIKGSSVPVEVQVSWLPSPPSPIVAVNLDPPIGAPSAAYTPIGSSVPTAVQVAWLQPPPAPIVAVKMPPVGGGGGIATIFTPTNGLNTDDINANTSFRVVATLASASNGSVQVTFTSSSVTGLTTTNCSVAKWDGTAAPSATTVPVELKFGGNSGFSIGANSSITSDLTNHSGSFSLGAGDSAIVVFDCSTPGGQRFSNSNINVDTWFLSPPSASWNIQSPPGFTKLTGIDYVVAKIETGSTGGGAFIPVGASVPEAVQVSWLPSVPAPIVAANLVPPISGPIPQNPPLTGSRVPVEVQVAWSLPALLPVLPEPGTPSSGPGALQYTPVGQYVPAAVQISWAAQVSWPVLPSPRVPPSAPGTYSPVGAFVPAPVQIAWLTPAPAPIRAVNFTPPSAAPNSFPFTGSVVPASVFAAWNEPLIAVEILQSFSTSSGPSSAPAGAQVPLAVLSSWIAPAPAPIVAVNLDPPISGPVPQNPPIKGSRVPVEVQVSWLPPVLLPVVPFNGLAISGPVVVQYTPVGSRVPLEVHVSWLPFLSAPTLPKNLSPPIAAPPSSLFTGSSIPAPTQAWWSATASLPQQQSFYIPVAAFPFVGARIPLEVFQSWNVAAPHVQSRTFRATSGPVPSQPPLGGGALVRQEVLVNWIPPPPAPILASRGAVVATFSYTFTPSWRVAVVPARAKVAVVGAQFVATETLKNKVVVVPTKIKVVVSLPPNQTAVPPRGR